MDKIIRATAAGGYVKMAAADARGVVERARAIHACSPTATAALGRTLCAASLLGDAMKEEKGSLTIRVNGAGPIGSIVAVSDSAGNVRGYVENPQLQLPLRTDGKLDVGGAVGRDGMLTVSRDLGLREPYICFTVLGRPPRATHRGTLLPDREQVRSAGALGVLVDTDRSVKAAGGFIVQLMPGADEELIAKLEDNIFLMDQLTTILDEDGLEAVFAQVLKGMEYHLVSETEIEYRCYCTRERVEEAICSIGPEELESIIAEGKGVSVSCQFCDKIYRFTPDELKELRQR